MTKPALLYAVLAPAALGLMAASAGAQIVISQPAEIQRPVVETFRIRTTVSAPASIAAPAMPTQQSTRGYIIARRGIERDIRKIKGQYLGSKEFPPTRARGLKELESFTDPVAVEPLITVLRKEKEDARQWLFEHLAERLDPEYGQATLAWLAIYDEEKSMRDGALAKLQAPTSRATRRIVERALQTPDLDIISAGAGAAGALHLVEAIPHLIVAQQPRATSMSGQGDLAYIQVGTQRYLVTDLQPVVGDNSVGFDPTLSAFTDGTVVRIIDAIVEFNNLDAHNALVNLVKEDFGQPVDFGFDIPKWKQWYEEEYLPFAQARAAKQAAKPAAAPGN